MILNPDKTATILSPAETTDPKGDTTTTYSPAGTVPCSVQPVRGVERAMSGTTGVKAESKMFCDPVDITEADRLEIEGVTYNILFIGRWPGHLEIELAERRK